MITLTIWLIIAALVVIFLVTSFIKLEHDFKAIKAIVLIVILLLIGGSIYAWTKSDKNDLSSPKGIVNSVYLYCVWVGDTSMKLFATLSDSFRTVGNAIKGNETRSSSDGRK